MPTPNNLPIPTPKNQNNPQWLFDNQPFNQPPDDNYIGFVYLITNLANNRKYIGKKLFYKYSNNKPTTIQSNWQNYTGSCKELSNDIKNGHQVKKEILLCATRRSDLNYLELYLQIELNVLLSPDYYNGIVNIRVNHRTLSSNIVELLLKLDGIVEKIRDRDSSKTIPHHQKPSKTIHHPNRPFVG